MATMTRDELADRLAVLKRQDWPRFSLAHIDADNPGRSGRALLDAAEDPEVVALINAHLRHFVPGACPGCGYGMFGWGLSHGSGSCSCGWPGTVYHSITDPRDLPHLRCNAYCNGIRVCEARRDEHIPRPYLWDPAKEELACPNPKAPSGLGLNINRPFTSEWRPPEIVRFETLLWAHPYELHVSAPRRDEDYG